MDYDILALQRFEKKLSTWKIKLLSIGGRSTLIKSVLGSLDNNVKKMHWVKWDSVLSSKENGGLDIGSFEAFNKALLYKWKWRLYREPNALWVKIIKSVHGDYAGFITNRASDSNQRGVWRSILDQDCLIANRWIDNKGSWQWRHAVLRGASCSHLSDLERLLTSVNLTNSPDYWSWNIGGDLCFSVRQARWTIDAHTLQEI
ncbi:hypothetical protein Tco_1080492 [Tanacetum coccineum]|uniref:Uncharacterized protein n=1 Tax=Tanacetum coccineum TaxID=301880 RepID=A0ABQ5HWG9_9ASTR